MTKTHTAIVALEPKKSESVLKWVNRYTLFVALVSLALMFCVLYRQSQSRINESIRMLKETGASLTGGYEDPIGPNFLFTGSGVTPANGRFPTWFVDLFCKRGYFQCIVHELDLENSDVEHIANLHLLESLIVSDCSLPQNWLDIVCSRCRNLSQLSIGRSTFNENGLQGLASLKELDSLHLEMLELEGKYEEFVSCLREIESLRYLALIECGLEEFQIANLRQELPSCEIKNSR